MPYGVVEYIINVNINSAFVNNERLINIDIFNYMLYIISFNICNILGDD